MTGEQVAVWLYRNDPDLPGLPRAAVPGALAALLNEHRVLDHPVTGESIALEMISYRPRRRAVLKAVVKTKGRPRTVFVKVLRVRVRAHTAAPRTAAACSLSCCPGRSGRRLFSCFTSFRAGR